MLIIDRYVVKNYLRYQAVALAVLVFIYVIINLFDNLGKYLARNIPARDIALLYLYQVPWYVILLLPVAAIIGVFFIFGFMTKHRELVALKSSGMDIYRLAGIILFLGALTAAFSFGFHETAGVWAQNRLFEHRVQKIDRRPLPGNELRRNIFYYGIGDWLYYIREFNPADQQMRGVTLWQIGPDQSIRRRIDAESGHYSGIWTFRNATVREFDSAGDETVMSGQTVGMPELKERPGDFLKRVKPVEEMNFLEIARFVRQRRRAGENVNREQVELHYRFSRPLITLILLLICLPLSLALKKGGIAIGLGVSFLLAFSYWGLIQSCLAYGAAGAVTPLLAAWLPNLIFGGIACFTALRIRR
jgi:lipopolysaccharide export system permease protein